MIQYPLLQRWVELQTSPYLLHPLLQAGDGVRINKSTNQNSRRVKQQCFRQRCRAHYPCCRRVSYLHNNFCNCSSFCKKIQKGNIMAVVGTGHWLPVTGGWFESGLSVWTCSPCICLRPHNVLQFPPTVQSHQWGELGLRK